MLIRLKRRLRRRTQSGAVAVMFGLLVVVLMSLAALGTDLGNQISRHTDTQRQADFGAFAAAQQMNTTAAAGTPVSAAIATGICVFGLWLFVRQAPRVAERL